MTSLRKLWIEDGGALDVQAQGTTVLLRILNSEGEATKALRLTYGETGQLYGRIGAALDAALMAERKQRDEAIEILLGRYSVPELVDLGYIDPERVVARHAELRAKGAVPAGGPQ